MNNIGHIRLHRKITDWEWYKKSDTFHLFVHLILKANFKESKFQGITINRGELIFGRKKASEETGISEQSIRSSIERLKSTGELTIKSTNKYSIITLCNYDTYQYLIDETNQQINQETNQQSTSNQPAINQQSTTSEELKNDNKEKKNIEIPDHLKEIWPEFLKMRKLIKKPATEKAQENIIKKLSELSPDHDIQIQILNQSINNSWQGVFPLQTNFSNNEKKGSISW